MADINEGKDKEGLQCRKDIVMNWRMSLFQSSQFNFPIPLFASA